jgi:hypothetical protein
MDMLSQQGDMKILLYLHVFFRPYQLSLFVHVGVMFQVILHHFAVNNIVEKTETLQQPITASTDNPCFSLGSVILATTIEMISFLQY